MKGSLTERAIAALATASPAVQRAFIKQMNFLARNLQHPGLHAKKYDESGRKMLARIAKRNGLRPPNLSTEAKRREIPGI